MSKKKELCSGSTKIKVEVTLHPNESSLDFIQDDSKELEF